MTMVEEMITVILYTTAGLAALGTAYEAVPENLELDYGENIHSQGLLMNTDKKDMTSYADKAV